VTRLVPDSSTDRPTFGPDASRTDYRRTRLGATKAGVGYASWPTPLGGPSLPCPGSVKRRQACYKMVPPRMDDPAQLRNPFLQLDGPLLCGLAALLRLSGLVLLEGETRRST